MEHFKVYEELGRGAFGSVYRAVDTRNDAEVAIKQIDLESADDDIEEIQKEIAILSTCHHPNITRYYGSFIDGFKLWVIMEYVDGGSCADIISVNPFSEEEVGFILHDMLVALEYLHKNRTIHRDIKAANILVSSSGSIKVADFGVSTQLSDNLSRRDTFVGTPWWMPPEIVAHKAYNNKADIWSLGITAIELATGKPPLSEFHPFEVLFKIERDSPPKLKGDYSSEFKDFVHRCLCKSPRERPSAKTLLSHGFITKKRSTNRIAIANRISEKRQLYQPTITSETQRTIQTSAETLRSQPTLKSQPSLEKMTDQAIKKVCQQQNPTFHQEQLLRELQSQLLGENQAVFAGFLKSFYQRLRKTNDSTVQGLFLPQLGMEQTYQSKSDQVEDLLWTKWLENSLERWS